MQGNQIYKTCAFWICQAKVLNNHPWRGSRHSRMALKPQSIRFKLFCLKVIRQNVGILHLVEFFDINSSTHQNIEKSSLRLKSWLSMPLAFTYLNFYIYDSTYLESSLLLGLGCPWIAIYFCLDLSAPFLISHITCPDLSVNFIQNGKVYSSWKMMEWVRQWEGWHPMYEMEH